MADMDSQQQVMPDQVGYYPLAMLVVAVLDQVLKALVLANLPLGQSFPLLPPLLYVMPTLNTGIAFSWFAGQHGTTPVWLTGLTTLATLGLMYWCWQGLWRQTQSAQEHPQRMAWAWVLILGGALGNGWDRVVRGVVVDYIDVRAFGFAIFNLADVAITLGVALLLLAYWSSKASQPAPQ